MRMGPAMRAPARASGGRCIFVIDSGCSSVAGLSRRGHGRTPHGNVITKQETETRNAERRAVLAVLGPTASGKSSLGLTLAERHGGEVVNCDSTAVYRGFDIGTDKLAPSERRGIPHHLIDIANPTIAMLMTSANATMRRWVVRSAL